VVAEEVPAAQRRAARSNTSPKRKATSGKR
jgi:hypothetical protein